jgi:chemotaxis protein MotB
MKNKIILWSLALGFAGLFSCVSQKKYDQLSLERSKLNNQNDQLNKDLSAAKSKIASLSEVLSDNQRLTAELSEAQRALQGLKKTHEDLKENYEKMLAQNQDLIRAASTEKGELSEALARQQALVNQKERDLRTLEDNLRENQEKLKDLQDKLAAKEQLMAQLREKIARSLMGFSDSDLSIRHENGKVYVTLSQNLLFAKGSTQLDNAGKDALKKLADALKDNTDIDINVEGHTDSDGSVERNWELSVTRATTIVKLLSSYGLPPERLTASGRALFQPVAPNNTEANKSKNRRTEIILSPKLDELYQLITPGT